jgi:hypothetical protein
MTVIAVYRPFQDFIIHRNETYSNGEGQRAYYRWPLVHVNILCSNVHSCWSWFGLLVLLFDRSRQFFCSCTFLEVLETIYRKDGRRKDKGSEGRLSLVVHLRACVSWRLVYRPQLDICCRRALVRGSDSCLFREIVTIHGNRLTKTKTHQFPGARKVADKRPATWRAGDSMPYGVCGSQDDDAQELSASKASCHSDTIETMALSIQFAATLR